MVDANEELVSMPYTYYIGEKESVDGSVHILKRMQFDSDYVQGVVAKEIAKTLKEQGKFVWRNGHSVIGGTDKIDKSSGVDIVVDGSFEKLTLQAYDAGTRLVPGDNIHNGYSKK